MTGIKIPKALYRTIEEKVVNLYYEQNITTVPIEPERVIVSKGYILQKYLSLTNEQKKKMRCIDVGEAISFYDPEKGTYRVIYDSNQNAARVRFTLMHELGHIDMGHKEESPLAKKMADYYAAYALAPSPLIYLFKCEDYADIKEQFGLSAESAYYRFQEYLNWLRYGGEYYKKYERKLLKLFK